MAQRLKQHNEGARLQLTSVDFLIARETPTSVGGALRHIRRRIGRDGFTEQSVHEHERFASRFFHYRTELSQEQLLALLPALMKAQEALVGVAISDDSQGFYRSLEFWAGDTAVRLLMQDVDGQPRFDIPEFEAAWRLVVEQFPKIS